MSEGRNSAAAQATSDGPLRHPLKSRADIFIYRQRLPRVQLRAFSRTAKP